MYISIPKDEEKRLTQLKNLGHQRFFEEYLIIQTDAKREGILNMLEYAGGTPKDTVVFGDDYNDLDMFRKPFYRVAMGNACDELKKCADYVTDHSSEDGIYNACIAHQWF